MQISFKYYPLRLQYIEDPDRVTVFKKKQTKQPKPITNINILIVVIMLRNNSCLVH